MSQKQWFGMTFVIALVGCSSSSETTNETPLEPVAPVRQPIVGQCTLQTFGQPCTDGSLPTFDGGAPIGECQSVCWATGKGEPICVDVQSVGLTVQSMNGRICGSINGTSCNNTCLNGACVA